MKIGYLTFGRDDFGYGLALVISKLQGHEVYRVTPKTCKCVDVLLFSVFWWEHFYLLADFMRRAGMKKSDSKRPRILVGGFCTFNPVPLLAYCDAVIVGDGEDVINQAVAGDYSADSILTDCKKSVTWGTAENLTPFVHETNGIARIELARGCKFACRFCAVKHLKKYRELPVDSVKEALRKTKLKRVSLFAPEPTMHSQDDDVTALCRRYDKTRVDSDVRLDRLPKRADSVPRVGIEGISYQLRKSVNKGYTDDFIIDAVEKCIISGRKGLFMYFILDLPGETEADWDSFKELITRIGTIKGSEKFLLKPSPSVFMPTPHTPMQGDEIHWDRDYSGKWQSFFGRGKERKWNVLMAERSRVFSPHMRLLSMMATRGGNEFFDVEHVLASKKIISVVSGRPCVRDKKALERELSKRNLIQSYCGKRTTGPWNILAHA